MIDVKEEKIIKTFAKMLPKVSEADKSYMLGLGEGMAIKTDMTKCEQPRETATVAS